MHKPESISSSIGLNPERSAQPSRSVNQALGSKTLKTAELHKKREELLKEIAELETNLRTVGVDTEAIARRTRDKFYAKRTESFKEPPLKEVPPKVVAKKVKHNQGAKKYITGVIVGLAAMMGTTVFGGFMLDKNKKGAPENDAITTEAVDDMNEISTIIEVPKLAHHTDQGQLATVIKPSEQPSVDTAVDTVATPENIATPVDVITPEDTTQLTTADISAPIDLEAEEFEEIIPEVTMEAEAMPETQSGTESEYRYESEAELREEIESEPRYESESELAEETESEPRYESEAELKEEVEQGRENELASSESISESEPEPAPEPTPEPVPEQTVEPVPELTSEPAPELVSEPAPASELIPESEPEIASDTTPAPESISEPAPSGWGGAILNSKNGRINGPSGEETYYNLRMNKVVENMHNMGFEGEYWVRPDGVKMFGNYVMVAADLGLHPRGSIVETSLGPGIVCDTGEFAKTNPTQLDIATSW